MDRPVEEHDVIVESGRLSLYSRRSRGESSQTQAGDAQADSPAEHGVMAAYNKYDRRLESLVVEARTHWAPDVGDLPHDDQVWLAKAIHRNPELAGQIHYERMHTGFAREITITADDIARLYDAKVGG